MKAVVLAGGLGTRLWQVVPDLPKVMAPVAGRPFLEYVLDGLIAGGVCDIILSVGYRAEAIRTHFGDAYGGAQIRYAVESEPLGTGGAIAHAAAGEEAAHLLVLNGDTFLDIDFRRLIAWHHEAPATVTMVLREVADVARYGAVRCEDGRVTGFAEKGQAGPGLINAGIYIIDPGVFAAYGLLGRFAIESDLLQRHCDTLRPRAFVTNAYFIDIGIPEDFDRAQRELPVHAGR
jgi:D-glycero-alpha-D-manno-heptose 1-phosphate guanylyltransferase